MLRIDFRGFLGEGRVDEKLCFPRKFPSLENSVQIPDDLLRPADGESRDDQLGVVPVYMLEDAFDFCLHVVGWRMESVRVGGFDE